MDSDFFELEVALNKVKSEEDSLPTLVSSYKKTISDGEDFALNFICCQPVPFLNQFRKIDSTGKLNKYINAVKSKKMYEDDMAASAVNLVGITDLFVCSLINDSLNNIFQKHKDKGKIKYYLSLIQSSWHRFFQSNISTISVEMVVSLRHFLFKWTDMLKETEHSKIFSNVTSVANEKYKSVKNLKDKNINTCLEIVENQNQSDVAKEKNEEDHLSELSKPNPLKRNYDSIKIEIQSEQKTEPVVVASPVPKKPKIDIRNYFGAKKEEDENSKITNNNNKVLKEIQSGSPEKKMSFVKKADKENDMDIEIVEEKKVTPDNNKVNSLVNEGKKSNEGKTPPKINAFQKLMESAKKRSLSGCK